MPIMTAGAGRGPVEAMLGKQPRATGCGEHLLTAGGAASSTDLTLGLPCQTQGLQACLEALPTTSVRTHWSDPLTCFSLLCPFRWKAPHSIPRLCPSREGPVYRRQVRIRRWTPGRAAPGHCLPRCPRLAHLHRGTVFGW